MIRDLLLAWRTLRHRRGFTIVAVVTLALGVAATTTMFSVMAATLLRPLPFAQPERLVMVQGTFGPERQIRNSSYPEAIDWRAAARSVTGLSVLDPTALSLSGDGAAEQINVELVSSNYFELLGASAHIGRTLQPDDELPGGSRVAVLSYALWQRRYSGSRDVIGRSITVQGVPLTVVGVMQDGFGGLSFGADLWSTHAAVTPDVLNDRRSRWLSVVGRLAPGQTIATSEAELQSIARDLEIRFPDTQSQRSALVQSLRDSYLGSTSRLIGALFGSVLLLLLIACINVTNLQLVRAAGRASEMSLRHALGASRRRILQQLVAEGIVLSTAAGGLGLLLTYWTVPLLLHFIPAGVLPPYATITVDVGASIFALLVALVCGTLSALVPALRIGRRDLSTSLRSRGTAPSNARRFSAQQLLVAGEIALAFLILAGAGLLVRSLRAQLAVDPGFRATNVVAARISLPDANYAPDQRRVFVQGLLERVRALPGVRHAAIGSDAPFRGFDNGARMQRFGFEPEAIRYFRHRVSDDYFATLGIQLVRGRFFTAADRAGADRVVVIDESAARRFWPGQEPIGQRAHLGDATAPVVTVIGVVRDVRFRNLTQSANAPGNDPHIYIPYAQQTNNSFDIVLQTGTPIEQIAPLLRSAIADLDRNVPAYSVDLLDRALAGATQQARFASALFSAFALLALLLATVGVYGVMAYYVSTSAREIAVRMALGAAPSMVQSFILRRGGLIIVLGTGLGGAAALAAAGLLRVLLFDVPSRDPVTFLAVALVLCAAGLLANYIPALRATRIAPFTALRSTL